MATQWSYPVLAYVLLVTVFIIYTMMQFYKTERYLTGVVSFILFILIFTFFGLRWFQTGLSYTGTYTGNWPPIINTCPDYLSLWKDSTGAASCVDRTGISTNNNFKTWTTDTTVPSNNQKFTRIYNPSVTKSKADFDSLKLAADNLGLTWEGITDGAYTQWAK
jgi:hypothetical protein